MKLDKICRMCSSEKLRVRPIFKAYKQERLLAIIKNVVRIEICEGDGLPSSICKPCATTLIRIQENLEEFRDNDRELRSKILGVEEAKVEQSSSDLVQELKPIEDIHWAATNEDPSENVSEVDVNESPVKCRSKEIEQICIPDDVATKQDFEENIELQNRLDFDENPLILGNESHEKISNLIETDGDPVNVNEIEFPKVQDNSLSNKNGVEIDHGLTSETTVTNEDTIVYSEASFVHEPEENPSDLEGNEKELVSRKEVYDEANANDHPQSDDNNAESDYEPDGKTSKPKIKPIRASQRQRVSRAKALTHEKKKHNRPPKFDDDDPQRPKINDYKCYICRSESLGSAKVLLEHLTTHLDRTPYTCSECQMETVIIKSVRSLNYHMKMHAQPMKCQYCDRRYCDDRAREYHVKTYHLGESAPCPSTCNECGKLCKSISALKTHMRDHRLNLRCEHCGKIFHRRGRLKDHIARVHEKAQKYECNICNRVVHSLDSYNSHLKMHTSEKTYECDICPMKFYTAGNLGLHKKIHSSNANYKPHKDWSGHYTVSQEPGADKIYTCKLCGKSYTKTVMKINNHLKSHFKDVKCDRCDLKFVNESQLKVHYVVHTGIRQHKCDHCGKDFLHKNNLTQHLRIHRTEREYACEFCGKLFTYKEGMKAHIRNHHLRDSPYKCTRCRRKFVDNASLERHITAEHEPPPAQVDLGPPPLMGTVSAPQLPKLEAIVKNQ